jgi:hypothetical protein
MMKVLSMALGFLWVVSFDADAAENKAALHFILSDGHNQLRGQSKRVADEVIAIFRAMGIDATWSSDPSASSTMLPAVLISVVPHSGRDWHLAKEAMAAVLGNGPDSPGTIFLFYPDIALNFRSGRTEAARNAPQALVSWHVAVARIITHEILHSFLPGRPHDTDGIFMESLRRETLMKRGLGVRSDTQEALVARLRALGDDSGKCPTVLPQP